MFANPRFEIIVQKYIKLHKIEAETQCFAFRADSDHMLKNRKKWPAVSCKVWPAQRSKVIPEVGMSALLILQCTLLLVQLVLFLVWHPCEYSKGINRRCPRSLELVRFGLL